MSATGEVMGEEATAKAVHKRYEGLVMVRNKAVRGKGAWYWAHLEPLLVHNADNGLPKAVKLKCCLCDTMFSASNPSRTASEHLKRGTCPNFSSPTTTPTPLSSVSPPPPPPPQLPSIESQSQSQCLSSGGGHAVSTNTNVTPVVAVTPPAQYNHRKRSSSSSSGGGTVSVGVGGNTPNANTNANTNSNSSMGNTTVSVAPYVAPISVIDPSRYSSEMGFSGGGALVVHHQATQHHHGNVQQNQQLALVGSGGGGGGGSGCGGGGRGDDLSDARGMFEDSIKRLKSPKASPGPALSKSQVECALDYLSDWVYESCGSVSFSSLEHPKFKAFLNQVGVPEVSKREVCGSRLDSRYDEMRNESEVRIRDAMFFQIASDGWKPKGTFEENLVNLTVNLPNGTSVYRRAVFTGGQVPCKYAEEVLWETMADICGNALQQCVGIVADKFKNSALKNLETQNQWMVNLSCQYQAFNSLIKDFYRELPLFKNVAENCLKLANFVNNKTQVRNSFHKYQLREYGLAGLLRVPMKEHEILNFEPVYALIEDIISSARVLNLVLLDESYKIVSMEDPIAREFGEMIRDMGFWNDLEAVRSLVRLVKEMAHEFETDRPLVGQCLHLWEELRTKVKDWCVKYHIAEALIEKVIERRFRKNYHPAWAAAYILDPLYLVRDSSGKYLPPFKYLTPEQEKDVDKLITRLVSREEAHIALMELMKWRTEGLDPVYAQAVQLKQRDPNTGKMKIANPHGSRLVWETYLPEFKSLAKVAIRLIFLHATTRGFKCNSSFSKWVQAHGRSRLGMDRAQKLIFIAAHSKLERRDFTSDEDKDEELFASATAGASDDETVGLGRPP
ncbi:uncharacterized protein LOC104892419 isoform X2 [Beta vulgaris subsp. vulgaris]|uniref:uncharacterized protein LOC104892419 isoform X2 n=1 Tax=Beta vulgaris subsp. vulgaris TaxID=3555 RepID=UPI0025477876|nr:uncharacterized protein LOC104892419 isoform X2 [Beta vulgaris subsp. vulgaris]